MVIIGEYLFPVLLIFPQRTVLPVPKRLQQPQSKSVSDAVLLNKIIRTRGDFTPAKCCR